jgi:hypothetical protein
VRERVAGAKVRVGEMDGPKKSVAELALSIRFSGARDGKIWGNWFACGRERVTFPLIRRLARGEPASEGAGEAWPRCAVPGNATALRNRLLLAFLFIGCADFVRRK